MVIEFGVIIVFLISTLYRYLNKKNDDGDAAKQKKDGTKEESHS